MKLHQTTMILLSERFGCLISCLLLITVSHVFISPTVTSANQKVEYFDIQGFRLNMKLDDVKATLKLEDDKPSKDKSLKTSKDKYGLIHGYEVVHIQNDGKLVLNFTGQKRLYRIDYVNLYRSLINNSKKLYDLLKQKYGDPLLENVETFQGESRNIRACWGTTCNRFTPTTPALKATIDYATGRFKLTLTDNRIFNSDWKKYKQSRKQARPSQSLKTNQSKQSYGF